MSTNAMMNRIAKASPRLQAWMAGHFYVLSVLTAAFTELFVRGRLNIAGGLGLRDRRKRSSRRLAGIVGSGR
jgi:hypothetical protein